MSQYPQATSRAAPGGRRTWLVLVGSASTVLSRFSSLILGLLLTGIVARYLSPELFGLWAILTFMVAVVPVLDIGIALALRNRLARDFADPARDEEGRICFFSVFYTYIGLALLLAAVLWILKGVIPWAALFSTCDPEIIRVGSLGITAALAVLVASLPFSVATAGFFSYQQTHWNCLFEFLRSLAVTCSVALLVFFRARFLALVLAFSAAILLASAGSFLLFLKKRRWKPAAVGLRSVKDNVAGLVRKGAQFGLMQLSATVIFSAQALVVANVAGLKDAGEYALVQKMFLVLNTLHFAVLAPLWSAYTESVASKDLAWVKKALALSVAYTVVLYTAGTVGLYAFGRPLILLWAGKTVENTLLYALMGLWVFVNGWVNCFSVYLNGIGRLRIQTALLVPAALAYVPLAHYCGTRFGLPGICLASIIVFVPLAISNPAQSMMSLRPPAASAPLVIPSRTK
jgi:O-antigen/teichoic acid export membrane protein